MKITNVFFGLEETDTRLKYSTIVPEDYDEGEFIPKQNFGFQENFRKTLDLGKYNEEKINEQKENSIKFLENNSKKQSDWIFEDDNNLQQKVKIYVPKK